MAFHNLSIRRRKSSGQYAPLAVKSVFFDRYLESSTKADIAVFIALAKTCDFSRMEVCVDFDNKLVTSKDGNAYAR